jgi:hypothetical protein
MKGPFRSAMLCWVLDGGQEAIGQISAGTAAEFQRNVPREVPLSRVNSVHLLVCMKIPSQRVRSRRRSFVPERV